MRHGCSLLLAAAALVLAGFASAPASDPQLRAWPLFTLNRIFTVTRGSGADIILVHGLAGRPL